MNLLRDNSGRSADKGKKKSTIYYVLIYVGLLILLWYGTAAILDCPEGDAECEHTAHNARHILKLLPMLAKLFGGD